MADFTLDGSQNIINAGDLGKINRGQLRLSNAQTLTKQEKSDWFKFRASGGIDRYCALISQTGQVATDTTTTTTTTGFTGVVATTKAILFFQRRGSNEIKRLGALDGFRGDQGFVLPKGKGTYYIKITRAGREAFRGDIDYTLTVDFEPSNLTTSDKPDGTPFFF